MPIKHGYPNNSLRYLDADSVLKLLEFIHETGKMALRNYAMILLMARLGLRSTEVIAIRLEDINWRGGVLEVRGKGKRRDKMPLPVDVGEAIVAYIRSLRRGSSRYLFVGDRGHRINRSRMPKF
ncbi:tyrosine-type recombinase/integrase [Cerasicoccus arenae]|uniref:tyrosine-type recombinase/integrase n=1 Tax=Cerasicoccus arenae TaxID=424488 RepID=UPI0019070D2E|nr:tyrosine-type recombinase/integrase [Cerasicoccus arenae]